MIEPSPAEAAADTASTAPVATSLRVNVALLDTLMTLAGELVLSRNQLIQAVNSANMKVIETASQRIDTIASEFQEAVMQTRMQPIDNILAEFNRVVTDMSGRSGKSIELVIEGNEVELDKTILESINDPLSHLVRNAVDHGIEPPRERRAAGKDETGIIRIKAFHEAGQVNILISDDGRGLDPGAIGRTAVEKGLTQARDLAGMTDRQKMELVFLPGFSWAKERTDAAGMGLEVVTTNIDGLGGVIELDSVPGKGTDILIKLPLTLAIIPSQITSVGKERYAVPQVNLKELLRIPAAEVKDRIELIGDAPVVRLRGELLPLINLAGVLGIPRTHIAPGSGDERPERRKNLADRRSKKSGAGLNGGRTDLRPVTADWQERNGSDRRHHPASAVNIAVVAAGAYKYGLVVDAFLDSEEIVVKPVGRHLKKCSAYAGATIMGDGKVALILDISNLAQMDELDTVSETAREQAASHAPETGGKKAMVLLTFKNGEKEYCAAPLELVERIEKIRTANIETIGGKKVVQYRGGALPLYELSDITDVRPLPEKEHQEVIVFRVKQKEIGLMVTPPVETVETVGDQDGSTLRKPGIDGSMIVNGHTTLLVNILDLARITNPEWF